MARSRYGGPYTPQKGEYAGQTFRSQHAYRVQRDLDRGYTRYERNKGDLPIPLTSQTERWLNRAVDIGLADSVEEARNLPDLKHLYHAAEREGFKEKYGSHFDELLRALEYHSADLGNTFDAESPKSGK